MQTKEEKLLLYQAEQERREQLEHRDVLLAIGSIIKTKEGIKIFEYLFDTFDVAQLPEGQQGKLLHEYLGFLKAGNAIYKLACEADPESAAIILSKLERKRYEQLYERHQLENELDNGDNE